MCPCTHVVYMHMKLVPARSWTLQVRVKTVPAPNPQRETLCVCYNVEESSDSGWVVVAITETFSPIGSLRVFGRQEGPMFVHLICILYLTDTRRNRKIDRWWRPQWYWQGCLSAQVCLSLSVKLPLFACGANKHCFWNVMFQLSMVFRFTLPLEQSPFFFACIIIMLWIRLDLGLWIWELKSNNISNLKIIAWRRKSRTANGLNWITSF